MKYLFTLFFPLVLSFAAIAQPGMVHTVVGGGTSTANGVPALSAHFTNITGLCFDRHGNMYVADRATDIVRKIDGATGLVYTIAGNGINANTGDGGPATNAAIMIGEGLGEGGEIYVDNADNLYIISGYTIRKVDAVTGLISSIAGSSPLGPGNGDGGPAINASLDDPRSIAIDASGNIYIAMREEYRVRKIDPSGIITTFAGNGTYGITGDGGAATAATLNMCNTLALDGSGNLYIGGDLSAPIRKVDLATGIITTVCGAGTTDPGAGDGGPALNAQLGPYEKICVDFAKNIYIMHGHFARRLRMVNAATGIITTLNYNSLDLHDENIPIANTGTSSQGMICTDMSGNIYFTDGGKVRKIDALISGMSSVHDSFRVNNEKLCNGPKMTLTTTYAPGKKVITTFGDGTADTSDILSGFTFGYALVRHVYPATGTYTIHQKLYAGAVLVDSIAYNYDYYFCRTLDIGLYYDDDGDCIKDPAENFIAFPVLIALDSNGLRIDTFSVTSGITYSAYGNPGDTYKFSVINTPADIVVNCPVVPQITDTISATMANDQKKFSLLCNTYTGFDYSIYTSLRAGPLMLRGDILVTNLYCTPQPSVLTLTLSNKYPLDFMSPTPSSLSGNVATWNFSNLSAGAGSASSVHINFRGHRPISLPPYSPGDTVNSAYITTPIVGDANPSDNTVIRTDTVRAGYDPNYIEVAPNGCIGSHTALQYTIHFENTGNDTAHNIYVLDTLSDALDPSTLKMVTASADMFISWNKLNGYTIVKFDFPQINLLDSSHHGECDGMLVYTIDIKNGLPDDVRFYSRAGIYFDVNPVVMTNTVENLKGCWPAAIPALAAAHNALIFPNPATTNLTIKTPASAYSTYTITNSIGQTLLQNNITKTQTDVNIATLPPGLYYLTLKGVENREVQKFIKL